MQRSKLYEPTLPSSSQCWRYNPADDSWTADTTLVQPRWGHTFEYVPDANNGSPNAPEVPVVFGTLMECDEYDPDAGTFADYRNDLPEVSEADPKD